MRANLLEKVTSSAETFLKTMSEQSVVGLF
ncbi:hypothetical protein ABIA20_000513 [Sinorhizobium fredii]